MVNCQITRGKRRQSGPFEEKGSLKKPRREDSDSDVAISTSEVENKSDVRKKRLRKRTKGLRVLIKNKVEIALRTESSPLAHLFTTRDDSGTPQAAYVDVIKVIGLSKEDWLKAASLPPKTVESISNITDMFRIERESEKLMLKYRPTEWSKEDCTVYLDNLPSGCTTEKISRIAKKFGSVVGAFAHNFPTDTVKERKESLVPLLHRLLMKIRILSRRRRRRTYAQNVLLMKLRREQAAIIKKERTANKRTCKISRIVEDEKNSVASHSEGRIPQNHQVDDELNTSSECGSSRRPSIGKRKKMKVHCHKLAVAPKRKKRKRRRRRKTEVGPHAILGSVDDYFAKIQVLPLVRYLELRREYVALRRESDRRTNELARVDDRFVGFFSCMDRVKLARKIDSYRDSLWETQSAEQEE